MVSLDFLEKCDIFKGLDDKQLTLVRDCCEKKKFERDDVIFGEGVHVDCLYLVKKGEVDLRFAALAEPGMEKKSSISTVSEAKVFGWSSFVPPYKTRLSAHCSSRNCKIVMVDGRKLKEVMDKDAGTGFIIMSNLAEVVGGRFHRLQDEIAKHKGSEIMYDW